MKNTKRLVLAMLLGLMTAILFGCGKDEKLKLVTTEQAVEEKTEAVSEETTEERQEPSEADLAVTLKQINDANRGDALLSSGHSYTLNTEYYDENGVAVYTEKQFLGFTEEGTYLQASVDEDGVLTVLDKANGFWYVVDGETSKILLYPEPSVSEAIINVNHNDFIVSLTDTDQTIREVYRLGGELVVETDYASEGTDYIFQYVLTDELRVLKFSCMDKKGTVLSCSEVLEDEPFALPAAMTEDWEAGDYRAIEFIYPDDPSLNSLYYVPRKRELTLTMLEYIAYSDEECTQIWYDTTYNEEKKPEKPADEDKDKDKDKDKDDGGEAAADQIDEIIYLKKPAALQ